MMAQCREKTHAGPPRRGHRSKGSKGARAAALTSTSLLASRMTILLESSFERRSGDEREAAGFAVEAANLNVIEQ
jgi:hypothetical protein